MDLFQKLIESESIIIEGDRKVGKLTAALYMLSKKFTTITVVSPFNKNKISKKISTLATSFINLENMNEVLDVYAFREDWINIKNEYGFGYLLKDLEYFISKNPDEVILFHRIGSLFEYADRDLIEDFFTELLSYGVKHKKKLVFTLNTDAVNYDLISYYLLELSDLYMKISKHGEYREIEVLFALTPIETPSYVFASTDKKLLLEPKNNSTFLNKDISVIMIAKDPYIRDFHDYLLSKEGITLTIVESISDILESILKNPDYIIFSEETIEKDFSICEIPAKYDLYTKILYLINQDFLRVDDRLEAIQRGCSDVLNFNSQKIRYVLELAKYLHKAFYKIDVIYNKDKLNNKKDLLNFIKFLLSERTLFTIVKVDEDINPKDYLRPYDKYVYLEDEGYGVLVLINLLKDEVSDILFKKAEEVSVLETQDCIDIYTGEELCIE